MNVSAIKMQMSTVNSKENNNHTLQLQRSSSYTLYRAIPSIIYFLQFVAGLLFVFGRKFLVNYIRANMFFTPLKFQDNSCRMFLSIQQMTIIYAGLKLLQTTA